MLLIVRFVALIILLILSPIGYLGNILPSMKKYASQWWKTLIAQCAFAPVYMILIYLVLVLAKDLATVRGSNGVSLADALLPGNLQAGASLGATNIIINFIIIIGFMNMATIIAMQVASGAGGITAKVADWGKRTVNGTRNRVLRAPVVTTANVGSTIGGAALRNTVGRFSNTVVDKDSTAGNKLRRTAAEGNIITRNAAKATLATLGAAAKSSYDVRNTDLGKKAGIGEGRGKGGYDETLKKQVEKVQEKAKQYGGATATTQANIDTARSAIATARNEYDNATDDNERRTAMGKLRTASADLAKHEKTKASEINDQQLRYITRLGTRRSPSSLWVKTSRKYKQASAEFLRGVRPKKEESAEAIATQKADEIETALKIATPASLGTIGTIIGSMTDNQIGKLPGRVFVDAAGTTIDHTIRLLKPAHLIALRSDLKTNEKTKIKDLILREATRTVGGVTTILPIGAGAGGMPTAEEVASADFLLNTPQGKSW